MPKARIVAPTRPVAQTEPAGADIAHIVNPVGAVHRVSTADAAPLLRRPGFRHATAGEIAAFEAEPVQTAARPIGKRGL